jgi:amino acid transporter
MIGRSYRASSGKEAYMAATGSTRSSQGLARSAIGLREVLFQSITHMAPAAAVAFSIIVGAPFAGGALPLGVLLALVACLFVASSIGQLAKHLPSAGGFATYASRGLHPSVGFLVAWLYSLAEAFVAPLLFLIFGHVMASTLNVEFGWPYSPWWWISVLVIAVIVFLLGWFGIRVSTGAGTILGVFEIAVFAVLAVWLIFAAGGNNTLAVFGTSYATGEGFQGINGVFAGSIYCILAFIGFEAAAPLAEEAKDPRRTVRVAVVWSALLIGLFYVLTTYAAAVYFGPERFGEFNVSGGGDPWQGLARAVWGGGWVLVFLAVVNSAIANANAGANATTRTWFSLGRIRLLPRAFANLDPATRTPRVAVLAQFVFGLAAALILGSVYGPLSAFSLMATILVPSVILIYIAVNLACIGYYARFARAERNWLLHVVLPVLGVLAFLPALLTALGVNNVLGLELAFISKLSPPLSYAGPIVGVWLLVGIVYLLVLSARDPGRVRQTGEVFLDEPTAAAPRTAPEPEVSA